MSAVEVFGRVADHGVWIGVIAAAIGVLALLVVWARRYRNTVAGGSARATVARRVRTTARDLTPESKELLRALRAPGRRLQTDRDLPHGHYVLLAEDGDADTVFAREGDGRYQQRYLDALEQLDDHGCLKEAHDGYYISDHGHAVLDYLSRSLADRVLPWR